MRLIFIDRVNIVGPDNRTLGKGTDRAVYLEAPVKQTGGTSTGRMVLGGIAENDAAAAGTFGMLAKASRVSTARAVATANGTTTIDESWDFTAASGEHAQLHVKYVRNPANRAAADVRFYNSADPTKFVIAHTEQETDITRNVTTLPPDRVKEFSFKVSGGNSQRYWMAPKSRCLGICSQPIAAPSPNPNKSGRGGASARKENLLLA